MSNQNSSSQPQAAQRPAEHQHEGESFWDSVPQQQRKSGDPLTSEELDEILMNPRH